MAEENDDWLFPKAAEQRAEAEEKGLVFAQRYLVFFGPTSDPRARALLEHWTALVRKQRIADDASLGEFAAQNAFCRFIEGIHTQIEFAQQGQNAPKPRTT